MYNQLDYTLSIAIQSFITVIQNGMHAQESMQFTSYEGFVP